MLIDPIWPNIFQLFIDLFHFIGIPILGGVFAANSKVEYERESYSYQLAGMTM
jgi:hypothetical protein